MRPNTAVPTDTNATPAPKKVRAKCLNRAPNGSKLSGDWLSVNQAVVLLDIGWSTWRNILANAAITVRQLPGEPYPRYSRADLERIAAESVRIARPKTA